MNNRVEYVAGRRKALARAVAIRLTTDRGLDWARLSQADRDGLVRRADKMVGEWIANGILATFRHEYREAEDPKPLADWPQ